MKKLYLLLFLSAGYINTTQATPASPVEAPQVRVDARPSSQKIDMKTPSRNLWTNWTNLKNINWFTTKKQDTPVAKNSATTISSKPSSDSTGNFLQFNTRQETPINNMNPEVNPSIDFQNPQTAANLSPIIKSMNDIMNGRTVTNKDGKSLRVVYDVQDKPIALLNTILTPPKPDGTFQPTAEEITSLQMSTEKATQEAIKNIMNKTRLSPQARLKEVNALNKEMVKNINNIKNENKRDIKEWYNKNIQLLFNRSIGDIVVFRDKQIKLLESDITSLKDETAKSLENYKQAKDISIKLSAMKDYLSTSLTILWKQNAISSKNLTTSIGELYEKISRIDYQKKAKNLVHDIIKSIPSPTASAETAATWIIDTTNLITENLFSAKATNIDTGLPH